MRLTDHELGVGSSQQDHLPPKWIQRIVAFGMDLILFVVILQLVVMFLPKLYGEAVEKEFQDHDLKLGIFSFYTKLLNEVSSFFDFGLELAVFFYPKTRFF